MSTTTASIGDLSLFRNNRTIKNTIPISSAKTPILLITASSLMPLTLIIVLITMRIEPSKMAFSATDFASVEVPIIWKELEIWGRLTCKCHGHCSNSGNKTSQINPACHPSIERIASKLCPLINSARQGKSRSQFRKAERHQQLTCQYNWPGPEKSGSGNAITQMKHLKKTSKNRNVREACSKT